MDPDNTQQPAQGGGKPQNKPPVDAQQAADLIRQQLSNIYDQQAGEHTAPQAQQASQPAPVPGSQPHFNPFRQREGYTAAARQAPPTQPRAPIQVPQRPTAATPAAPKPPIIAQRPPAPTPQPPAPEQPAHFNPYRPNLQVAQNPILAANQDNNAPIPPTVIEPPHQPGGAKYRQNYSTFAMPGESQTTAASPPASVTPQAPIVEPPKPVTPSPVLGPQKLQEISRVAQAKFDQQTPVLPQQPVAGVGFDDRPSLGDLKDKVVSRVQKNADKKKPSHWKPLIVSLAVGLTFLMINYNQIAIAQIKQYISPGDAITTPIILDPNEDIEIGPEPRIIIPKINLDVPVVYDIKGYDEAEIQDGLERGVVHYGTTALPGQKGNNVIVGHSSNNYFNSGEYKFAFVLLFRLEIDDTFIIHYKGERYVYRVFDKKVIEPNDFSVIQPTSRAITTLITCTPPGTSWQRLIIQAEQISPDPADAAVVETSVPASIETSVPGNAPSLWQRITDIF